MIKKKWYIFNAKNKVLGRLATIISTYLQGKHKPEYVFHKNIGDYIIVINAKKIKLTGNKALKKQYYHHTGYPGGIKKKTFKEIMLSNSIDIIKNAVKNMLPKNSLGKKMYKNLKVYPDIYHNHKSQNPIKINI